MNEPQQQQLSYQDVCTLVGELYLEGKVREQQQQKLLASLQAQIAEQQQEIVRLNSYEGVDNESS